MYKALVLTTVFLLTTSTLATHRNSIPPGTKLKTQAETDGSKPAGGAGSKPTVQAAPAISRAAKQPSDSKRRADRTGAMASQASEGATTTLGGVFRFTCDDGSGFLQEQCRAGLFDPCTAGGSRVALTTDSFLSLRIEIDDARDGDTWIWNWRSPDGRLIFPARLAFHDLFNGQELCFEFSAPFGLSGYVCGSRSISFEWGSGAIRRGPEGLWFVDLSYNNQPLFHEPFELFEPPRVEFVWFSALQLASGILEAQVNFTVSPLHPSLAPWTTNLRVLTSTDPQSGGSIDYELQPGANTLRINLQQLGIGRFDDDVTLRLRTATPTGCPSISPQETSATLDIPLPVIFVHGYVEGSLRFSFGLTAKFVRFLQADPFFAYLADLSTREQSPSLGVKRMRIPYSTEPGYPTLSMFDWIEISDAPVETIIQRLQQHTVGVLAATYATRVNLLTHSLGGFVGRLAIANGARVRKLIMVGCPNNGTSSTLLFSNRHTRVEVNQLATGIVGYAIPQDDGLPFEKRGPYQKADHCACLSLQLQRRLPPPLPSDPNISVFNIFTSDIGTETPWDLIAIAKKDWYTFQPRQLDDAQDCDPSTAWPFFRIGDGIVSVQDATLGVNYDMRIQTNEGGVKIKGAPHLFQLGNNAVREAIARYLDVID